MKILQITPHFYPSLAGIETYTLNLSRGLSQLGHRVDVLTINTNNALNEEVIAEKINVYRCSPTFRYGEVSISVELARRLIKAKDYDLYHVHVPFPLGLEASIAASRINHTPLVATHHGEGTAGMPSTTYLVMARLYNLYNWFARSISLRCAGRLVFYTQSYATSLGLSSKIKEKVRIVRPGTDIEKFSPLNDGSRIRAKYSFDDGDKVILFVGALGKSHGYKGVDYLIKAIHLATVKNSAIKLVIVGGGDLVSDLKRLAKQLNLEQHVLFTGPVPNEQLPPYYAICDVFVLPSISGPESFGIVLQEAMASGKPCIASDIPGVRETIADGKTGLLVRPKDPEALAQAILRLAEDDNLRGEMGHNARKDMERYSWARFAEEIEAVYKEVAT